VLDLDGERIVDSTRIIAALEGRFPERPLYPADPDERRRALELEDHFDEHAGHDMRRVGFWEQRDEMDHEIALLTTDQPAAARVVLRGIFPLGWRYVSRRYSFDQESFERSRVALVAALDRIESSGRAGTTWWGMRSPSPT
jgi:glutathione S-transferase